MSYAITAKGRMPQTRAQGEKSFCLKVLKSRAALAIGIVENHIPLVAGKDLME
jgi:hypothetical protein